MTGYSFSTPVWDGRAWVRPGIAEAQAAPVREKAPRQANGPEGVPDWEAVNWQAHEGNVRRLRQRIFKAAREQDWAKVRNLQKLMLRSWSNTLISVRQVTQRNAGRKTTGIYGRVAITAQARAEVAEQVQSTRSSWRPVAVKRVYIPKAHYKTKMRPLGIPVIMDR